MTISPDSVTIVGESTEDVTVTNTFLPISPTSVVPVTGDPSTPATSAGPSGTLPFTGSSNAASLAVTGLALLIGGAATLWFSRHRVTIPTRPSR